MYFDAYCGWHIYSDDGAEMKFHKLVSIHDGSLW